MLILRLFHQDDPFNEIDARLLNEGDLSIGRDPGAGWMIEDRDCQLSRVHCALHLENGRLTLRDTSTNGVFLGEESERLTPGKAVTLREGETFRLGRFFVLVDESSHVGQAERGESAAFAMPETPGPPVPPRGRARAARSDIGAILDAFCTAAQIDSSALVSEEPLLLAKRIGEIYHEAVAGLAALMHERTVARNGHEMERTTVGAADNNPFKWAPTQRVAVDLLRPRDTMFLSGAPAIEASFADLRTHLLCVEEAASAALGATLTALAPAKIEEQLGGRNFVLRNKTAEAWRHYQSVHAEIAGAMQGREGGAAGEAFRTAYQRHRRDLEAKE